MKKLIYHSFLIIGFIISPSISAQLNYQWAESAGSNLMEYGQAIASDPSGNVYVTGSFSGTVDFDPSAATATLAGLSGSQDIFLAKYNSSGAFIWVKQIAGTNTERPFDLVADATGAYLAGIFLGTIDFDPSAAVNSSICIGGGTDGDGFFAKYDVNGNLVWVDRIGSNGNDRVTSIAVDASQNVFVAGFIGGNTDMDPSAATVVFPVPATYNCFFGKYTSTGAYSFAKQITGGYSEGDDLAIDATGNIYLTGSYATSNDFDPAAATTANLSTSSLTQLDIFLAKYDASGNYTFAKQIGGVGVDIGFQVKPDASGNIYLGGVFSSVCDFDPTATVSNLTSAGQGDLFVAKYTSAGLLTWVNGTGGTTNDYCYGLGLDASNNVYITGNFQGSNIDFDPSASTNSLTASSSCMYIASYNSSGTFQYVDAPGNIVSDGKGLIVNSSVYVTGFFNNVGDFDFSAATANLTSVGSGDILFAKYNLCTGSPPALPSAISGNTITCTGTSQSFSVTNDPLATSYIWTYPNGWSGSSITNTTSVITGTTGIITVAASNSCGAGPTQTLNVSIGGFSNTTITSTNVSCFLGTNGKAIVTVTGGIAPFTYSWNPSSQNTPTLNSATSGIYTVTIIDSYNCSTQKTVNISQPSQLILSINTTSNLTCFGSNNGIIDATASGGTPSYIYAWSSTSTYTPANVSFYYNLPAGNYTLSVIDTKNCITSFSYAVTQPASLTVISLNTNVACNNANGAASVIFNGGTPQYSYTWNAPLTQTTNVISGLISGNYMVTCTDANNCVKIQTLNIPFAITPTITTTIMSQSTICEGETVTITAIGASTYLWDNTSNANSISVTPTINTTYSVTGTSTAGCSGTAVRSVSVIPSPTISVSTTNSLLCLGETATLIATGATTYTWSDSSNSNSIIITPTATTTYTLIGASIYGCTNTVIVTQSANNCTALNNYLMSDSKVEVFPNPFKDELHIKGEINSTIEIINTLGQITATYKIESGEIKINTENFKKGIYFVRILNDNSKPVKLIKE